MKWIRRMLNRTREEERLEAEMRFHVDRQTAGHMAGGMSEEEARRRARMEFGALEGAKEECREAVRGQGVENFLRDLGYGVRMLHKNAGFTIVAMLTLALGIGASTAVFSLVNAVLLKPLPYPHPERIVMPWRQAPPEVDLGYQEIPWGYRETPMFLRDTRAFQKVGVFKNGSFNLTGNGEPALLEGHRVSAGFFGALGVTPELGRTFTEEEDQPGHQYEVIVSHNLWRQKLGGSGDILGRTVELNGMPYVVVGVMPPGFVFPRAEEMPGSFNFPKEAQLWVPLALPPGPPPPTTPSDLAMIARLADGVTIEQAQAELDLFAKRMEELVPRAKGWFGTKVTPLESQVVGGTRQPLLLILGAVCAVLLIACSNVAALVLVRALGRKREFTMRAALGADPGRLIRQVLTESMLLAAGGGALGLLVGEAGVHFVKVFGPENLPRLRETALDWRVFLFSAGLTLLTGVLFGMAPALGVTRTNLVDALKDGGNRSGGSLGGGRLRRVLVASEVALALVLVVAAGLLTRTFLQMAKADPGFRPEKVLTFQISLPGTKYPDNDKIVALYDRLLRNLAEVPGVEAAGIGETVPMGGLGESTVVRIMDRPATPELELPYANYTIASPGFFSAVGTPVLRGRDFLESDRGDSQPVAIINNVMARKNWPAEEPLGKLLGLGSPKFPPMQVVGIVADIKHQSMREEVTPEMYVMYTQKPYPSMLTMQVVVRTRAEPAAVIGGVRQAIGKLDPALPVAKVSTLENLVEQSMTQPRFAMLLLGAFGALAVVLATIGLYGVISYSVSQRTQEIGVRMALGAPRRGVFRMVLAQGARLAVVGIATGTAAALGITQLMKKYLYGVTATDPLTFAGVVALLLGVALLASYVPARQAMKVDPMVALRHE